MYRIEQALEELEYNINAKSDGYYNSKGTKVPRVTSIISKMIHNDALMYWANSLGLKGLRYRNELNKAANIGTIAHKTIENFLKKKLKDESNTCFLSFLSWYNTVTQDCHLPIEVIYLEHTLACRWFGGTLDGLLKIGNKTYLIDFKTSNHVTYTYFLQLAAYRYMLREVEGVIVDGIMVLQLDKYDPGFNEYLLRFDIPDHLNFANDCEIAFLSLVYGFYNISKAENDFASIFTKRKKKDENS